MYRINESALFVPLWSRGPCHVTLRTLTVKDAGRARHAGVGTILYMRLVMKRVLDPYNMVKCRAPSGGSIRVSQRNKKV